MQSVRMQASMTVDQVQVDLRTQHPPTLEFIVHHPSVPAPGSHDPDRFEGLCPGRNVPHTTNTLTG